MNRETTKNIINQKKKKKTKVNEKTKMQYTARMLDKTERQNGEKK